MVNNRTPETTVTKVQLPVAGKSPSEVLGATAGTAVAVGIAAVGDGDGHGDGGAREPMRPTSPTSTPSVSHNPHPTLGVPIRAKGGFLGTSWAKP